MLLTIFDTMLRFSYAADLHKHLKGFNEECDAYTATSTYELVTWAVLIVTLLFIFNYYLGFLNRPMFTNRLAWLVNLLIACSIVFVFAYFRTRSALSSGFMCSELHFSDSDILLFGLTAATYTFIFGLLLSVFFKYLSVHNRRIPF